MQGRDYFQFISLMNSEQFKLAPIEKIRTIFISANFFIYKILVMSRMMISYFSQYQYSMPREASRYRGSKLCTCIYDLMFIMNSTCSCTRIYDYLPTPFIHPTELKTFQLQQSLSNSNSKFPTTIFPFFSNFRYKLIFAMFSMM